MRRLHRRPRPRQLSGRTQTTTSQMTSQRQRYAVLLER